MKKNSAALVFVVFLLVIALLAVALPKKHYSENEKRVLSEFPSLSLSSLADGSFGKDLETYLSDHFPLRDLWVGLHAYSRDLMGQNGLSGVYRGSGYLFTAPGEYKEANALRNIRKIVSFAESTGLPASVMVVPSAGYMMPDKLPANHEEYWDGRFLDLLRQNAGSIQVIDLRDTLSATEDAYYRTDHHLTSAGSYAMYQAYFKTDAQIVRKTTYDGFYGTAYSKSGLWGTESDKLEVWEVPGSYTVSITEGKNTSVYDSLYFYDHLKNMDQYPVFLDGNHALVTVENAESVTGRRLLIIKDSYAHCFSTFAATQCDFLCMVDLRYYKGLSTSELIEKYGITEILYLYGAENLASSTDLSWLK